MKLSGTASLPYFILPNGKSISSELYIDALEKGFMIFSPQLCIGDKQLASLQFNLLPNGDSLYYDFEAADFAHAMEGEPGIIKLNGSFLPKNRYAEANVMFHNLFADSIMDFSAEFLNEERSQTIRKISTSLNTTVFSGDMYLSSDFKSLSYNVPYIIVADSMKENRSLLLSFGGNEQSLTVNKFNAI